MDDIRTNDLSYWVALHHISHLGALIIEGNVKSGAMITARLAGEQNREVFAVPGSIFSPQSRGPFDLLRDGETPVANVEHILEALNLTMIGA